MSDSKNMNAQLEAADEAVSSEVSDLAEAASGEAAAAEASELAEDVPAHASPARLVLVAAIMCVVVALDQLSKAWARTALASGSQTFIPGIIDFRLTFNTGAAFSIGQGKGLLFVLVALAVAVAVFVLVWRAPKLSLPLVCALACIAGGGIGNMIDRVAFGEVTDFIAAAFIDFPIFNVADMFVTCGVIVAIILILTLDKD